MLPDTVIGQISEWQNQLYSGYLNKKPDRIVGIVIAVADVALETIKTPAQVIESAIMIIVNLGGVLFFWHQDCSFKDAIACVETGIACAAVTAATCMIWIPYVYLPAIPAARLVVQWGRVLYDPATATSIGGTEQHSTVVHSVNGETPADPTPSRTSTMDQKHSPKTQPSKPPSAPPATAPLTTAQARVQCPSTGTSSAHTQTPQPQPPSAPLAISSLITAQARVQCPPTGTSSTKTTTASSGRSPPSPLSPAAQKAAEQRDKGLISAPSIDLP